MMWHAAKSSCRKRRTAPILRPRPCAVYIVKEIPCDANGDVDIEALQAAVSPATAGIMLTNPSTLGVFERKIVQIARIVHDAGGLLYYDGANLNAILARCAPAIWDSTSFT